MRSSPTTLRRLSASAAASVALVAVGAVLLTVPARANHTAPNGSVRSGPDLVFTDCTAPGRTTTRTDPTPAPTTTAGTNPQAASTGSGCTVQATTLEPYRLVVRFTFDAEAVPGREIRFQITGDNPSNSPPAPSSAARLSNPNPPSGNPNSNSTTQFCITSSAGECSVDVTKDTPGFVTITATERDSGETANETVEFRRNRDNRVTTIDETNRVVIYPAEDDYTGFNCEGANEEADYSGTGGTPGTGTTGSGNGCPSGSTRAPSGTPGRPVQVSYQLLDRGSDPGSLAPLTDPGAPPRPLTNRSIRLTLNNPAFFFTPNCGPIIFPSGSATVPARGDYRRCDFRNASDGSPAGLLTNLGQSQNVVSDENGIVTVTVAVDRNQDFDDNGVSQVLVEAPFPAQSGGTVQATEPRPSDPSVRDPAPLNFNTRNRPLNGLTVRIETVDTDTGSVLAERTEPLPNPPATTPSQTTGFRRTFRPITATTEPPLNRPDNSTIRFGVFLFDQFTNLVRVPETDVAVSATGPGVLLRRDCRTAGANFGNSICTNPAAANTNFSAAGPQTTPGGSGGNPVTGSTTNDRTTGSYRSPVNAPAPDYRHEDPFTVTSTQNGPVTLSATWQAPQTVFTGGGVSATGTPTPGPTSTSTATATPTVTPTSTPTATPTATATPTVSPSPSTTVSPTPSATVSPTVSPTASPTPTQAPRVAGRVRITSSHSRVTAGNAPTIQGQVFDTNGAPLGGVNVTLFEKSFGERSYSTTDNGQATSDANGRFTIVVRPINQTSYGANTDDGRANSNVVQIRVNARMDILSPAPDSVVSNPVTLSGRLLPAYNGRPIGLAYINSRGSYVFLGQANSVNGSWSVRSGGRVPAGTYTFVVYMSPTQGTDRGARSVRLTVR